MASSTAAVETECERAHTFREAQEDAHMGPRLAGPLAVMAAICPGTELLITTALFIVSSHDGHSAISPWTLMPLILPPGMHTS